MEQSYEWNVEQTSGTEDVDYVKRIKESSRIYFKQAGRIDLALKSENPEVNLFHLFLPTSYLSTMLKWTNVELVAKGKDKISLQKFKAAIGLEIAM